MRLWTVQGLDVVDAIEAGNEYLPDISKSEFVDNEPVLIRSYEWMRSMMERRIPVSRPHSFPVWSWPCRDDIPRMEDIAVAYGEDTGVIVFDAPDNEVLLSDFDAWHFILNDWPLCECQGDGDVDERTKLNSWLKVFDVEGKEYVQACTWGIGHGSVREVRR